MSVLRSPNSNSLPAIECRKVSKLYYLYQHRTTSLREWFIRSILRKSFHVRQPLFSLTDFDITVKKGECIVLVGSNGSGKSTALRLIAGIYEPSTGSVETRGRIGTVIELGAGFHMELTGAENVDLYAAVMGLSRRQLGDHYDKIVEFAAIGDFIDVAVKYYSSGMRARLAFAVAVCVNPDILLLDEVFAVGDQSFREKCIDRLQEIRTEGRTMVFASHDLELMREMCSRAIWLEHGRIRLQGEVSDVLNAYQATAHANAHAVQ